MAKLPRIVVALSAFAVVALGAPAYASHGNDDPGGDDHGHHHGHHGLPGGDHGGLVRTGPCRDDSRWKLQVKHDDGSLEVEAGVESHVIGQNWFWQFGDNGTAAASGSSTTGGRSGAFRVVRTITDQPGTDAVTFQASNGVETCSGSIAF